MGKAELSVETWEQVRVEAIPLLAAHRAELDSWGDFALDDTTMTLLDMSGQLLIATAREEGELVGYCFWIISHSIEDPSEQLAELKPWYVAKGHRASGLGLRLFRYSLAELRRRGVSRVFPHHWGNPTLGKFFERLGARPREWVYEMRL